MKTIILSITCALIFATAYGKSPTTDTIRINLGEKLVFLAEANPDGSLTLSKPGPIIDSSTIISIELSFSNGLGTTFKISNPFTRQLVYKAELYSYKKKEFLETSTVPVYPGISSFEMWPYKIDIIQLSGFKLVDKQ